MEKSRRVLVVEDEGLVAQDIQNRLRRIGYDVPALAGSGEEALALARDLKPDLILMDIQLRGDMDGIETADAIHRELDVPVVFLTAHADNGTLERAKQTGPFGYVLKPFEERELHVSIELALHKHAADRVLAERDRWLGTTLHSIGDGVIATDEAGLVKFMNPVAELMTGLSSQEAAGRPLHDVFVILDEESGRPSANPVDGVLEHRTVIGFSGHTLLKARDGSKRPIGDSAAPILDDHGKITGVVLVFRDLSQERAAQKEMARLLTEVQQANLELANQKGFLSALFEAIPSAVLVVGEGNRVQIVNRTLQRTFGPLAGRLDELLTGDVLHCHETLQGAGACGVLDSCEACQVTRAVREALAGQEIHRRRAEFHVGENGSSRSLVLLITAAPLEYEGSRGALVILEDATELNGLQALIGGEKSFSGIIGHDRAMQEVYEAIRDVAEVTSPVLIQGESGTGKELVARAIHREGPRAAQPFIAVNCGAIPETLLESELFGHVKGAFTGAIRDKKGRFELADGGTIFLDEVADLSPAMQVKLMRVLQERTFERVGGEKTLAVDVRVISASNRDLRKEIAAGRFREDLYYRLCVIPIHLPPLRERAVDVPLLAEYILERVAAVGGRPKASIGAGAMALLMEHPWPGNVRELQNVLEFALVKSRGEVIEAAHLPAELRAQGPERPPVNWRRRQVTATDLERALAEADGNKVRAASLLGISRATLYRLLNQGSDPSGT